jgi:1-acyl-sn-glycerol-3-phosphate acyltransferase
VSRPPQQKRALHALLSFLIFDPLIYLYTVVMGSLSLLSSFVDRDGSIQHWFARTWSWLILKTIFSPVTVVGLENIPNGPAVYAANHQSAMDIPLLYVYLPMQFRIIAKVELFRYPFMGWHLSRSGQIAVDEKNVRANLRSLNRAVETVHAGMPLVVFPEGGRTPDGEIKKFMSGAFYVAIKAQVPVVPVAIVGTYKVLKMNQFVIHPGPLQLVIGKPISTEGYSTRGMDALAEKVKAAIEDLYYARAETRDPRTLNHHVVG